MTTSISSLFHVEFFYLNFVASQLTVKKSAMWSTNFLPSKLTEILGNLFRFQFIKFENQQNCSNVKYLCQFERYKEGKPYFGKLIRLSICFWCTLYRWSIIGNQRRYSSPLLISMFIGTLCTLTIHTVYIRLLCTKCYIYSVFTHVSGGFCVWLNLFYEKINQNATKKIYWPII